MKHKEFEVHLLNAEGIKKANEIALAFDALLTQLEDLCSETAVRSPINGREMAIVRTDLERASFFAKKAMAILPENQK